MLNLRVLQGPNLNLLGEREPEIYGRTSLDELHAQLHDHVRSRGHQVDFFQSNAEHELIDLVHRGRGSVAGIVINPGALTHTSIALRDALLGVGTPFVEVHLSNVHAREPFRRTSHLSDIALGVISGLQTSGYWYALDYLMDSLAESGSA